MRGAAHLALAALVVASALTAVATPAAAGAAFISVDVAATPDPASPGDEVTVTTTVDNLENDGESYKIQRVELRETRERTDEDEVASENPATYLDDGDSLTVNLTEQFDDTGEFDRYVHLKFISSTGDVVRMVRPVTVTVEQPHPAMSLSAEDASASGETDLSLTVANGLPDEVRGVTVELASDDLSIMEDRHVVSSLRPGNEAVVDVPVRDVSTGRQSVDAHLTYLTADGESRTVTQTLSATVEDEQQPAEIDLTGQRVTQEGQEVIVRGSASNAGSTNASSVKIAVTNGEGVAPAQNQASFFVGEVAASDYESFEVHARLTGDANETVTIPLEVNYSADGDQVTRTIEVQHTPQATPGASTQQSSSPLVPALAGLVLVAVAGGLGWRRYR